MYGTRGATLPRSEPLPTTTTGRYTICCKKNLSLALLKMGKICPKHVEVILEINKTLIVASRWFLYYLTYIDDALSNTNQVNTVYVFHTIFTPNSHFSPI